MASAARQANPVRTAFGSYPMMISTPPGISSTTPVTVRFYNADSVSHESTHRRRAPASRTIRDRYRRDVDERLVRKVTVAGTYEFSLHDQGGPATVGRVVVR